MAPRTGRPRTGVTPIFAARVSPAVVESAKDAARASGKRVGVWIEEAITEKLKREHEGEHVTTSGS